MFQPYTKHAVELDRQKKIRSLLKGPNHRKVYNSQVSMLRQSLTIPPIGQQGTIFQYF